MTGQNQLPLYDPDTACPKCGQVPLQTEFVLVRMPSEESRVYNCGSNCPIHVIREPTMKRTCGRCGARTYERPLDG